MAFTKTSPQLLEHLAATAGSPSQAIDVPAANEEHATHNIDSTNELFPHGTDEFAGHNLVKGPSVRKRYSQTGSYFGVRPIKLANGRLKWPRVIVTKHGLIAAADTSTSINPDEEPGHGQ